MALTFKDIMLAVIAASLVLIFLFGVDVVGG